MVCTIVLEGGVLVVHCSLFIQLLLTFIFDVLTRNTLTQVEKPSGHSHSFDDSHGLFPRMPSISSMTSGVSLGSSFRAAQLSWTCCTLLAPRITVLTWGFFAAQASASWLVEAPSFSAIEVSFLTFSIFV